MAATATKLHTWSEGNTKNAYLLSIALDSSYPANGEVIAVTGIERIDLLLAQPTAGYSFQWDVANQKLVVRNAQLAAGTGTVTGATLDVVTGLPTAVVCGVSLGEDPGAGAGDVFAVSAAPHATPGTITISIWQDDATAATEDRPCTGGRRRWPWRACRPRCPPRPISRPSPASWRSRSGRSPGTRRTAARHVL